MLRERNQSFKLAFIFLDLLISFFAISTAFILHFYVLTPEKRLFLDLSHFYAYLQLAIFLSLSQVIVFIAIDIYHPRRGLSFIREFNAIGRGIFINLIIILAFLFFYRVVSFSRLVLVYTVIFSILFHVTGHYLFRRYLSSLRKKGYNLRHVLILGTGRSALRCMNTLERHAIYGYRVLGLLGPKKGLTAKYAKRVIGTFRDIEKIALHQSPDLIVYAMPYDAKTLERVMNFCDQEGYDCRIIPEIVDLITAHARIEDMDGMPVLTIRDAPLRSGYNRFLKRTFDILFSFIVLILISPVLILIAALVKWDSPGPVFFFQERMGLDRKTFHVIKFRTMTVVDRGTTDTAWGSANESRITGTGKFLRKSSLDELPQFFNVLRGDMSVVGPRPERPHFVKEFKSIYSHYMRRHSVKAGVTGWAQIQGFRGDTSIQKRVEADIFYIENWTLWFDILIVLKTIPALIKSPGE